MDFSECFWNIAVGHVLVSHLEKILQISAKQMWPLAPFQFPANWTLSVSLSLSACLSLSLSGGGGGGGGMIYHVVSG